MKSSGYEVLYYALVLAVAYEEVASLFNKYGSNRDTTIGQEIKGFQRV